MDRVAPLARLLVHAILFAEGFEALHQRGGRRDRIPGADRGARIDRPQGAGRVAVDQDRVARRVHRLEVERQGARIVCLRVVVAELDRRVVRREQLRLLAVGLLEERFHDLHVDPEQGREGARVGDVSQQCPLAVPLERLHAETAEGDAEDRDPVALEFLRQRPRGVVEEIPSRADGGHVLRVGGGIERHDEIHL